MTGPGATITVGTAGTLPSGVAQCVILVSQVSAVGMDEMVGSVVDQRRALLGKLPEVKEILQKIEPLKYLESKNPQSNLPINDDPEYLKYRAFLIYTLSEPLSEIEMYAMWRKTKEESNGGTPVSDNPEFLKWRFTALKVEDFRKLSEVSLFNMWRCSLGDKLDDCLEPGYSVDDPNFLGWVKKARSVGTICPGEGIKPKFIPPSLVRTMSLEELLPIWRYVVTEDDPEDVQTSREK